MITGQFAITWIGWILAGASPGPATMGIAVTAMTAGRRSTLFFALGILAGGASWGIAAALGLSAIMLANARVFELIRYAGVLYLGWLAVKALRRAISPDTAAMGTPFAGSGRALFAKGFGIHVTNPKAILSWGSIYAIVAPSDATLAMLLGYFALLYMGRIMVFISYAFLFSSDRVVRAYADARRWFDLAFAGFFGFAAFKILTARLQ